MMDSINAQVAFDKLNLELQNLELRTVFTITSQAKAWRNSIMKTNSNIKNCQFDVYNEDTHFKVKVVMVIDEQNFSFNREIIIDKLPTGS